MSDTKQTSRGKLNRIQCTTAGSTLRVLDGYGLRDQLPARPTLAPRIRFLFIGSHLCSTLPSDLASRRQPLRFTNPSPPSGWVEDFHLRAIEHARHTTNPLSREGGAGHGPCVLSGVRSWVFSSSILRVAVKRKPTARSENHSVNYETGITEVDSSDRRTESASGGPRAGWTNNHGNLG
jgi:hypothetical protein